jgi:nucleoside-diphosphate-sugar epimerase
MKVLVTGASGYLGRHVLKALEMQGIETVCAQHRTTFSSRTGEVLSADLLSPDGALELVTHAKATHLLHLAWYVEQGKYWNSPQNFEWVQASIRLVDAFCRQGGKHVVVAGTCAEYDWDYSFMQEGVTPYNPHTPYGICKNATRQLLQSMCDLHNVRLAWGHVFFPFGMDEAHGRLIPSLIKVFRGQMPAFGVNSESIRGMLPITDAAQAFSQLLQQKEALGVYNICSGIPTKIEEIVTQLAMECNADPAMVLRLPSARLGDPAMLLGDNQRLRALGWRMQTSLQQCLKDTVQLQHPQRNFPSLNLETSP